MQVKQFSDRLEIHCGMIEFLPTKTVTQVVAQMLENHPEFRPLIERVDPLYNGNCNIFKMLVKDFPAIHDNAGFYLIPLQFSKKKTISSEEDKQELFLEIARKHFGINSLETVGLETFADETNKIWAVKAALLEAFNAGVKAGLNMPQKKGQS